MGKKIVFLILFLIYSSISFAGPNKIFTIFIDPKFGGTISGPVSKSKQLKSKDVTLKLGKKIKSVIQDKWPDYEVILTREQDVFMSEEKRIKIINSGKEGILLSIGVDWSDDPASRGVSLVNSELIFEDHTSIESENEELNPMYSRMIDSIVDDVSKKIQNNYDSGIRLSKVICGHLVDSTLAKNCSTRIEPDTLLIHSNIPSTLVNLGYLSNDNDIQKLSSDDFYEVVANSICFGLSEYIQMHIR